jgi:hypothetical protein
MNTFKYKDDGLSEEHIKQICLFLDKPYVKGEHQKMQGYIQFKIWHKREMNKRDLLQKNVKYSNK